MNRHYSPAGENWPGVAAIVGMLSLYTQRDLPLTSAAPLRLGLEELYGGDGMVVNEQHRSFSTLEESIDLVDTPILALTQLRHA